MEYGVSERSGWLLISSPGELSSEVSRLFSNGCTFVGTLIGDEDAIWKTGACGDKSRGEVNKGPLWNIDGWEIGCGNVACCGVDAREELTESDGEELVGEVRDVLIAGRRLWVSNASRSLRITSLPCWSNRATMICWLFFGQTWLPNLKKWDRKVNMTSDCYPDKNRSRRSNF